MGYIGENKRTFEVMSTLPGATAVAPEKDASAATDRAAPKGTSEQEVPQPQRVGRS